MPDSDSSAMKGVPIDEYKQMYEETVRAQLGASIRPFIWRPIANPDSLDKLLQLSHNLTSFVTTFK